MTDDAPVYLKGVGALTPDGSFYSEEKLRRAAAAIAAFCEWFESLPTETQDFIRWEAEA